MVFKVGRHALCVFLSASSAENTTSALIINLGAKPSRKHRNSMVLYKLAPSTPPELQQDLRETIQILRALEPHITKARYPILRGLNLLPPSEFYTRETAERALAQAREVLKKAKLLVS